MIELLTNFTPSQILIFIVLLALAFKAVVDFIDWGKEKLNTHDKKYEQDQEKEKNMIQIMDLLKNLTCKVDILMNSDRDDIKSYITERHHYFCYQKGWIDDFSLDCLERRYQHYVEEDGNSYIGQLMEEIRVLPKQSPDQSTKGV